MGRIFVRVLILSLVGFGLIQTEKAESHSVIITKDHYGYNTVLSTEYLKTLSGGVCGGTCSVGRNCYVGCIPDPAGGDLYIAHYNSTYTICSGGQTGSCNDNLIKQCYHKWYSDAACNNVLTGTGTDPRSCCAGN